MRQAEEGEQVEACRIEIETEPFIEQDRHEAGAAQRREKGEGKRHAGEVGCYA
jgi:hypothetical protein